MDTGKQKIVLFSLEVPRYALYLTEIERIIQAVEITPLPKAPDIVLGVINFQGKIIPVIDIRKRFNLVPRELMLEDQFLIVHTSKRELAIVVDAVAGIFELDKFQVVDTDTKFPYADYLSGIAKIGTDIVLINDIDKFISLDEEKILDNILSGGSK